MRVVTISNLAGISNSPGTINIVLSLIVIDNGDPDISYDVSTYYSNDALVDTGSKSETIVINSNSYYVFFNVDNTYESSIGRTSEYAPIRINITPSRNFLAFHESIAVTWEIRITLEPGFSVPAPYPTDPALFSNDIYCYIRST